jgi:hypothetical protein
VWLNAIQEGSLAGRRDEGLNIEAADEPAMADAMTISLDIAPYQDRPNPAFGIWTTKKSKSVFGGSPSTMTSMISTGPTDSMACSCSRTCSSFIPARCRANQIAIARARYRRNPNWRSKDQAKNIRNGCSRNAKAGPKSFLRDSRRTGLFLPFRPEQNAKMTVLCQSRLARRALG